MHQNNNHKGLKICLILLILVFLAGTVFFIKLSLDLPNTRLSVPSEEHSTLPAVPVTVPTTVPAQIEAPTEATQPQPETVIATATISAQGDLLMQKPIFASNSIVAQGDGSYDFSSIFKYFTEIIPSYDYAIANLETTFGGDDFPYQGSPFFNCPDSLADAAADAGYDMLLTANNHSYDTEMTGITRTLEVVRASGIDTLGTRLNTDEPRYKIVDINGIKIGMVCYTYTSSTKGNRPRLNGSAALKNPDLANWFHNHKPEKMYEELKLILEDMETNGADITMMFIHWGNVYERTPNFRQVDQAQALCDLGVDIIVGGHPHVVQPVELLTSTTDPEHQTICLYSVGNAVSNERAGNVSACPTRHTEDGILFEVTFEKYSDGNVYIQSADILPTWVNMHRNNGAREYNMIPLVKEQEDQWQDLFEFDDVTLNNCKASYKRTMEIIEEGLMTVQEHLSQEKEAREQYYLDLAGES